MKKDKTDNTENTENQRRLLQEYIFDLEDAQEKAEELTFAHEKIYQSQELLMAVLGGTTHGVCLIRSGAFAWCNKAFTDILGWELGEIIGKTTEAVYPAGEDEKANVIYGVFQQIRSLMHECELVHKDGHRVPCLVTGHFMDVDDRSKGYVLSITDFTEQKKIEEELVRHRDHLEEMVKVRTAKLQLVNDQLQREINERRLVENALKESENWYRAIFDNTGTATVILDENTTILLANAEHEKLSGYTREELEGKKCWTEFVEKEEDLGRMLNNHKLRRLNKHAAPKCYEFKFRDRNGRVKDVILTIDVIPGTKRSVASLLDITERKKAQEERQKLEERLHRAEKMEALGIMAGGVAHDLNNVLGVLVGYSELLLDEVQEENRLKKYAANILQSGQKGAAIIQDLLTLARRGVTVSEVINLNDVICRCLKSPELERIKKFHPGVTIDSILDKDLLNLKGSPVHLEKMLFNLLSNAAEAIFDCGKVTIRTENRHLDKPVHGYDHLQEGDYAVLHISDNGKGISSVDMEKIFEPFYTKKVMGKSGTGLGLAVVWGTVKDHKGYIDVQSEEGKGSIFSLYFPIAREEKVVIDPVFVPAESYTGRGESILVVDDVQQQRELAVTMLSRLGYQVNAVSGGEEAVAYIKNKAVDLMVLDMIMEPGIDGLETYKRVLEINPKQKAVIVSGFSETKRVEDVLKLGAGCYIRKPYVMEKIGTAIRDELLK
ncbi:MAG: PAS domain S-box protein [Smithella sp.]